MIGVSSRVSASFSQDYTVDLFQSAKVSQTNQNGNHTASVAVSGHYGGAAARAIDSILNIVQQSNGNTSVGVETNADVESVATDQGNDDISVRAARVYSIASGGGNDTIDIESRGETVGVYAGGGNDTVNIDAGGNAGVIAGGDGNDTLNIRAGGMVAFLNGGEGNDTINIEAEDIRLVAGGSGNDTVSITNNGSRPSQYYYFEGDGQDSITSNGAVELNLFNEEGTSRQDMANAEWTADGNRVTVSFADGGSISVQIDGTDNADVRYDAAKGSLVIGAAQSLDANAAEALHNLG